MIFMKGYSMAQASKAILPKDVGGPWGQRIGVSVGGSMDWALIVGAYVTGRVNPSDWLRYSLVVLNWLAKYLPRSFVADYFYFGSGLTTRTVTGIRRMSRPRSSSAECRRSTRSPLA